jgi:hypothetical protein
LWRFAAPAAQRFDFCRQMKNAAVDTTTSNGAAVSSSNATAVQSVYMPGRLRKLRHHLRPGGLRAMGYGLLLLVPVLVLHAASAFADVEFTYCHSLPDGGLTCDTRPTGNTLLDDEAARYGLFNDASPGWQEYDPYQQDEEMLGGNET